MAETGDITSPTSQQAVRQWLSELARGNRLWIRSTVVAGVVAGIATIAQMVFLARIIHLGVIDEVPVADLTPLFLWLILALFIRAIGQGFQTRLAARCSEQVRRDARRQIHKHWQATGPVALGQSSAGTLAREWIGHVEALHGYFARFLPQMMLSVVVPMLILVLVFWLDWLAGMFLILSAPLIPLFMALVGMGAEKLNQQHFETISRLSGQFLDKVRGLTTLQLFGQTADATELIRNRSDHYRRITMKTLRVAFLSSAVLEFFASVAIAVIAIYIGFGLLGYITYGPSEELTLFSGLLILLLAPEFFQPLRTLSQHYHDRAAALGAGAEILQRLTTPVDSHRQLAGTANPGSARDVIELDSVSVTFRANQDVLRDVSLVVANGEVIALTGPSGGGKSTLLHLLAGFMAPDSGRIHLFAQPPGSFRFGWLGQKGFLVQGTWADNLRLTTPDASDIAIDTALRNVGLGPLLDSRQEGINSLVSEDGQGLSGGQARRLSLARIFLADYDLILLDEPTAGLDSDSEVFVLEALHKLAVAGKTLIFSTHHQALLTLANRVLLVSDGEVRNA
ncbi:cysteine/glutathione ABC transporter membrane/ATP-binding protein [Marinobacter lipolyticus SM19]|uniref:Cysteine/glutathione ABC transporter membrane/ATP-binding protein n=1 Tax=Marinobacter lipolyticus SM19 TaxID=1318628 RepID=R8B227_9GAMM|nr:thiol reductant ABC exporter subunit CydD [Marinobacter lipolyticus]EON92589.1 cysteine/glutathione ABC transporter membrane/ATP-binding protein [Marinobacter lipolyticus SM19]